MTQSLSLLFPVCNAQRALESQVERVLDILPELSERFDVVIIDDGSTDDTHEVAADLARRYPQVEVIRHRVTRGLDEAIATGRKHSTGDVVLVHTCDATIDARSLATYWSQASGAASDPTASTMAPNSPAKRRQNRPTKA